MILEYEIPLIHYQFFYVLQKIILIYCFFLRLSVYTFYYEYKRCIKNMFEALSMWWESMFIFPSDNETLF